jgi:ParB family chromosome partitioning protein
MDGQIGLDMTLGPYVPDQGSGNGQTSAISEDWYTPAVYVEATRELLGTIDLDPASCPEANLTVRAENIYTAEVDGLRHRWFGNVFLNPPWGRVGKPKRAFVTKAIAAYEAGEITAAVLALNSNATTSAWFQPLFRYPICFPNHRVEHRGPGGSGGAPNSGTVFVYLGPDVEGFAQIFSRFGAILHELRAATAVSRKLAADYEDEAA